ncbi:hypothetical protein I317_03065 [Kwoniella heveanensis CBS 569]|uniref:Uncharacterized protein n=1 Tax=Kwoniella heveanensis BCC8398 TaxID=1296120 RepID=A0A1B9GV32_9TREE|nr:hypothetical protein I316_03297 [Kwoniella heveanensis BCC8398]OCF43096.1 hypothetical protein I317_03065 [Kwoniella heveanensis CBS 569]
MGSDSNSKKATKKEAEEVMAKRKAYLAKADPTTVENMIGAEDRAKDHLKEGRWKPSWAAVEFDGDACLSNITFSKPNEGFYAPAGTILPLGAQMPEMTVLRYGGYIPEGTSFPGGVMVPMHARMVILLPEQSFPAAPPSVAESLCLVQ